MSRARDTANQINRVNSSAADATALTVDSSENVGIGTASPVSLSNQTSLTINGTSVGRLDLQGTGQLYANSTEIVLQGSYGKPVAIDAGTNQHISFRYATSEKMRIDTDGLKFNGDTAAANALDDYEEGTFNATWVGTGTSGPSSTMYYTKIGNTVHIFGYTVATAPTPTGSLELSGLPFMPSQASSGSILYRNVTASSGQHTLVAFIPSGNTRIQPYWSAQGSYSKLTSNQLNASGSQDMYFGVTYMTAS